MDARDTAIWAVTIRHGYPKASADLARAEEHLRKLRSQVPRDRDREVWQEALARSERDSDTAARRCEVYAARLQELAVEVLRVFPRLWPALRLVDVQGAWHEDPQFDWTAGEEELRKIEAAAVESARDKPPDPGPPEDILAGLSKQHRKLFAFFWEHPSVEVGEVERAVWRNRPVEPATVQKALTRFGVAVAAHRYLIETKAGMVTFHRPDKT